MTAFGLVHGGGLGAWSWDLLRPLLEDAGCRTVAPELPLDDAGLDEIASIAAAAFGAGPAPLIVVGHALGCAALPLIALRSGAAGMIWVCGVIPRPGSSTADQISQDPTMVPMFSGHGYANATARQTPADFKESLFHDCDAATRAWVESMMGGSPDRRSRAAVNAATDPFPMIRWPSIRADYVVCRDDRGLAADWSKRAAKQWLGIDAVELPGGHCPMIAQPAVLAAVLLRMASELQPPTT